MSQPDETDFLGLSAFKPGERRRPQRELIREIEQEGAGQGFVSREAPERPLTRGRRQQCGPASINVRVEIHEFNRFVRAQQASGLGRADFVMALLDAYERSR